MSFYIVTDPPSTIFDGTPVMTNQTLRIIAHPSMGSSLIRLHLSNVYGAGSVTFDSVHVAKAASTSTTAATIAGTDVPVTFRCSTSVTIPAGQQVTSDPIDLSTVHGDNIAVSMFMSGTATKLTYHLEAWQTNYASAPGSGDTTTDSAGTSFTGTSSSSHFLTGIDANAPTSSGTIVAFGDSITDGMASTSSANHRWPDLLADLLDASGSPQPIINEGIAGDTILRSAVTPPAGTNPFGDPGVERFERDVVMQANVRAVIILEGTNDLGESGVFSSASTVYQGLVSLAQMAHTAGIKKVYVGTITPRTPGGTQNEDFPPTQQTQLTELNVMIRASNVFDGVIEWHDALQEPGAPEILNPPWDSGDGLHPNDTGYQVMANTVDLSTLR